ncbi:MAG TPA: SPOR domain-containing protein [Gallionellaceae bacterium]|nr:SPOR domain-containing protein [Gallionellaceae bacterium]
MIRRLVVGLVLANILFFAYMQWGSKLGGDGKAQPLAALNPDKIKLLNTPVPEPVQPAPPAVTPAASTVTAAPAPVAAPVIAPAPAPATAITAAPVPVATPQTAAPAATAMPKSVSAPTSAPSPAPRAAETGCLEWGEFSGTDLARAEKALAGLKLGDHLGQRTVEYNHGYLVYIAPFKTQAGHTRKIRELKAAGVDDYFVIKESGKLKNAISLGVFKTEEAARHYRSELGKKGLKSVQVGPREAKLKFTVFTFKRVDAATATQLDAWQKDYPGSELKTLTCGAANGK